MKAIIHRAGMITLALGVSFLLAACGKSVSGNTYVGAAGVSVAFESGGKATASLAGIKSDCTYTEDGKTVTLTCAGRPRRAWCRFGWTPSGPYCSCRARSR